MNDIYNYIEKEMHKRHRDLTFSPKLLDELDNAERIKIEQELLELVNYGVLSSFQYIPYFETFSVENSVKISGLLSPFEKLNLAYYMYVATKNKKYFNIMLRDCDDFQSYSYLLYLYDYFDDNDKMIAYPVLMSEAAKHKDKKEYVLSINRKFNSDYYDTMNKAIIGFIVGDALGVPVEFSSKSELEKSPLSNMIGYGTHHQPAGTFSDDTSMTLATMQSIADKDGIDFNDMMDKFVAWRNEGKFTADKQVFDIGNTTNLALNNYLYTHNDPIMCGRTEYNSNGNGSLMRMLPIALYVYNHNIGGDKKVNLVNDASSLTHAHDISKLGCLIYVDFVGLLLKYKDKMKAYEELCKNDYSQYYDKSIVKLYEDILSGELVNLTKNEISTDGYVVSTLKASIWGLLKYDNYKDIVLNLINLGDDTDTVGAIAGSLGGIIYGDSIPIKWKNKLRNKKLIGEVKSDFMGVLLKAKMTKRKRYEEDIGGKFMKYSPGNHSQTAVEHFAPPGGH